MRCQGRADLSSYGNLASWPYVVLFGVACYVSISAYRMYRQGVFGRGSVHDQPFALIARYLPGSPYGSAGFSLWFISSLALQVARLTQCERPFTTFSSVCLIAGSVLVVWSVKESLWPSRWRRLPGWWCEMYDPSRLR